MVQNWVYCASIIHPFYEMGFWVYEIEFKKYYAVENFTLLA